MNTVKKITLLLTVTVIIFCKSNAQSSITTAQKIVITKFKVYEKDAQLFIDWQTDGTIAANYWQLQSSIDGQKFTTFALVFGPDPRQKEDCYQYKGKIRKTPGVKPIYRLCPVDNNEKEINIEILTSAK